MVVERYLANISAMLRKKSLHVSKSSNKAVWDINEFYNCDLI